MNFDIKATLAAMLNAVHGVVAADFPKVRACVQRALNEEREFLSELAKARIDGEIDDEILARQLSDEKQTLEAALLACEVIVKVMAQNAANAAIDAFNNALKLAIGSAIAGAPVARVRGKRAAKKAVVNAVLSASQRRLNARPDTVDFRDLMYVPTLVEVGTTLPIATYLKHQVPVLDQGTEGACTGFGLATVANYLLRTRKRVSDKGKVSPRMIYALARRYDEWPGETYEGSSCRGAMKGWHKHGVCREDLWAHDPANPDFTLTRQRAQDALKRPLGAYFRVNHRDLVAMHAAISEVGILYASASVHSGWDEIDAASGRIPFTSSVKMLGGHAFAVVAYDENGFWIQNSWGKSWGRDGFGHVLYEDWLKNGTDVWVARLGVPTSAEARSAAPAAAFSVSSQARAFAIEEVRPHVVSLGNDGRLRTSGNIGSSEAQLRKVIHDDLPASTKSWKKRRIVLYAHGGLVGEDGVVQRVAEYRKAMMAAECYPLAFIWHSDYWTTLTNMLSEALRLRRPEGVIDAAKDFMLDRLDDALEPIARKLTGKASWDEMKENALRATQEENGGARFVASELATLAEKLGNVEFHVVGHSAGSIFHAPLVRHLTETLSQTIESVTLWAPACTTSLFEQFYVPALKTGSVKKLALYTLTDHAERDDNCARIYNKSLLYLVSHAFEKRARIPLLRPEGEAILGMEKFAKTNAALKGLLSAGKAEWITSPNDRPEGDVGASRSTSHGGFDDDMATVLSTLARIVGKKAAGSSTRASLTFRTGQSRLQGTRERLNAVDGE